MLALKRVGMGEGGTPISEKSSQKRNLKNLADLGKKTGRLSSTNDPQRIKKEIDLR